MSLATSYENLPLILKPLHSEHQTLYQDRSSDCSPQSSNGNYKLYYRNSKLPNGSHTIKPTLTNHQHQPWHTINTNPWHTINTNPWHTININPDTPSTLTLTHHQHQLWHTININPDTPSTPILTDHQHQPWHTLTPTPDTRSTPTLTHHKH